MTPCCQTGQSTFSTFPTFFLGSRGTGGAGGAGGALSSRGAGGAGGVYSFTCGRGEVYFLVKYPSAKLTIQLTNTIRRAAKNVFICFISNKKSLAQKDVINYTQLQSERRLQ